MHIPFRVTIRSLSLFSCQFWLTQKKYANHICGTKFNILDKDLSQGEHKRIPMSSLHRTILNRTAPATQPEQHSTRIVKNLIYYAPNHLVITIYKHR